LRGRLSQRACPDGSGCCSPPRLFCSSWPWPISGWHLAELAATRQGPARRWL